MILMNSTRLILRMKKQRKALSLRYEYSDEGSWVNFTYSISHLSAHTCQWLKVLKYHRKRESLCESPDGFGQIITHTHTHRDTSTHRIAVKMLLLRKG